MKEENFPAYLQDLIVKMDFIGHTPVGHKINHKTRTYVDPNSWGAKFSRWSMGEDGEGTCNYIDNTAHSLRQVLCEERCEGFGVKEIVLSKARLFRQGLINIIETYRSNPSVASRLRTILSLVDLIVPVIVNRNEYYDEAT